ncbi:MAG: biotin-dependent carboxyltransferase family protein [Bacteroidota bacterium]
MIRVLVSGLYTSLQDFGRYGYRNRGVPVSGVMDRRAAARANEIVGNELNTTVMECTLKGPVLTFEEDARVAICGAQFLPTVDGISVPQNKQITLKKGSTLSFGNANSGVYGYLAVRGGFLAEAVLGSTAHYNGITEVSRIKKGMILQLGSKTNPFDEKRKITTKDFDISQELDLEVYKGPEYHMLSQTIRLAMESTSFTVSAESNRMAYVVHHGSGIWAPGIVTAPVQPGTVQLTPAGKMIVLMRDAQTTGGYARIFQLTEDAMCRLAQKRAGEPLRFQIVDLPITLSSN